MSKFTGEVIKHGDAKCVQNEGMPMYRNPCEKGQLYINFQVRDWHLTVRGIPWITYTSQKIIIAIPFFKVEFPEKDWLPEHLMYQLERLLPPREDVMLTDDMEEVDLSDVDIRSQERNFGREAYEEDDEGPRGGVQCQTQWFVLVLQHVEFLLSMIMIRLLLDTSMQSGVPASHFHRKCKGVTVFTVVCYLRSVFLCVLCSLCHQRFSLIQFVCFLWR